MFDQHGEIKKDILEALTSGPRRVSMFTKDWPMRPRDMKCEAAYREALLELESEKKIEVLAKDRINVVSAGSRPWRAGKPTLAKDYYVRHKTIL
jgi:hypothetical protein